MSYIVQTLNNIAPRGLALLEAAGCRIDPGAASPDALLVRSADLHQWDFAPNLLAVGRAGAGVNNIPVTALSARGIPVFNTPGANANAVKELVLAGMLLAARNLPEAWGFVAGLDPATPALGDLVEREKKRFQGTELAGKVLAVLGLGAIGARVAEAAVALGMTVHGYDPALTPEAAVRLPAGVACVDTPEAVLAGADFVTLHVPLLPATRHLLNASRLALLPPSCVLLNFSREGIVDDAAAVEALKAGKLRYYVGDFPNPTLLGAPRVLMLPHLGASTMEAEENCAVMAAEQLRDYLAHGTIRNAVNFPNVQMERQGVVRVTLIHDNVPNMLGRISTALAAQGYNIEDLVNKSREDLAYTLLDLNQPAAADVAAALAAIPGVRRVRIIP